MTAVLVALLACTCIPCGIKPAGSTPMGGPSPWGLIDDNTGLLGV